jgi:NADH:ubiquinone reductase (non-electrogenic)
VERKRLLILGTGFGAFALLRGVDASKYDVTVVSPRNHFLFTPLLPSTTVGTVEFRTILEPVRRHRPHTPFHLGRCIGIDFTARIARCRSELDDTEWDQPFDLLVVGVGCITNTFHVPGVAEHACFLKEIDDARRIRQTLAANLERASLPGTSPEERDRLLHFVSVGGGPTGVRFAGELFDLLRKDLPRTYPHLAPHVKVTILDAGPSMLGAYDESLRAYVQKVFVRRGVNIRTGTRVQEVTKHGVVLPGGESLPCGLVLWSAGFAANPLTAMLDVEKGRGGRIVTDDSLEVPGKPNVFAMGDCASPAGTNLPQLAQVAEQQGRHLARSLNVRASGRVSEPFRWKPWTISSFIGGGAAVGDTADHHTVSGFLAYQQWRAAIWTQLVRVRSKVLVPLDRLRAFAFGRDINRL